MKSSRISLAVVLGALSIVFIISFQVYWVYHSFDIKEDQFNQRVSSALLNVADRIADFNGSQTPDISPVIQMTSSYFIVDVNESIDPVVLEHFLKSEFNIRAIDIDFEYAIYDCETDRMVYGKYIPFGSGKTGEPSEIKFRKVEELAYYFGVFFPTKPTYILQSMNLWIISLLLILTALGFFIYAITIILRQKRLSEIQKDFINNMTHEFKTPISSIAISAEVLREKDILEDPEKLRVYANIIAAQNTILQEHIERVLQSASMERQQLKLQLETIDICSVIKEVCRVAESNMGDKQKLEIQCPDRSINIKADRIHLSNMIYNLVDNALKYGGDGVNVNISCMEESEHLFIQVEDDGPGIDRRYHKKIFNRFFRVPQKQINTIKGFGLGLNYLRYMIRAHGWKINIESSPGNGSKFIIVIRNT